MNLVSCSSACDRTGVSDCATTITASAVFYDNAGCFKTNLSLVLDRSKVTRSCQKHCSFFQERTKETDDNEDIIALYFGVRKD